MHTASYEFLMKPKKSAGCHQSLSAWVGSGDETRLKWVRRYGKVSCCFIWSNARKCWS